jgi:hypothetical protein
MVASDLDRDTLSAGNSSESEEAAPLDFAGWSPQMLDQLQRMIVTSQFVRFPEAPARVGNCAHPLGLRGSSMQIDPVTGEILSGYSER